MRTLIDTNILISAAYSAGSAPHQAYKKATTPPNQGLICQQSLEEMRRVFTRKFPHKIDVFERFIATALIIVELVPMPFEADDDEIQIRDATDRPILRAARKAKADVLLTGDKDFISAQSAIKTPRIMTAADFLEL